ncbi:MAG: type II toxin-antitoxin system PemK/MazF family toxin [Bacteroidota bacterium]
MKLFDQRNQLKKQLDASLTNKKGIYIKEREIWNSNFGVNIGSETDGKPHNFTRPVLVIKKVGSMFFVVPMTTSGKDNRFYHTIPNHYFRHASRLMLSQAKVIDRKRFIRKIGILGKEDFLAAKEKLKTLLF